MFWHICLFIREVLLVSSQIFDFLSSLMSGYGYQWWVPEPDPILGPRGEYMALGIYGQSIFVSPADGIVVARNAAWPTIKDASAAIRMFEQIAALSRAIAVQFAGL
jgi:CubicO group peptidase (beta-lactamase class C family)